MDEQFKFHVDKKLCQEAERFRRFGDNAPYLREQLVRVGLDEEVSLLDNLKRLTRPQGNLHSHVQWPVDDPLDENRRSEKLCFSKRDYHFDPPAVSGDAVAWLEQLGGLKLTKHFQCMWAACTMVIAAEGWLYDYITRRARRWVYKPPNLPRAAFLLHWSDYRDVVSDWQGYLAYLKWQRASKEVSSFVRTRLRESGFAHKIMPPLFTGS